MAVDLQRYLQLGNPAQGESKRGLEKGAGKRKRPLHFGELLNSLWWPVYVIVFVQVEVPSSNRVRKLFCGFESFLGPQKVHGYHRINSWDMCMCI